MNLTINGKEYELKFGLKFIRSMDKLHEQTVEGIAFGLGLEIMTMQLEMNRATILVDIIRAATSHGKQPTVNDIEDYLEDLALKDELNALFDEFKEATGNAPFLKQALNQKNK